ncbi:MAG: hypothetical protein Kow0068_13470 [Marinilabiliales bacterium]
MDQTIDYINKKLNGETKVDTKKNLLIVEFYKDGNLIRQDEIGFEDIAPENITYNYDEKAIIIKCMNNEKCVFRKLYKEKIKRYYSRINIPFESDEKSINGLKKALKHLVRLAQDDSYKSDEPFE